MTNQIGGAINGGALGVYIKGAGGTVANSGTIGGSTASVVFAGTGANTLTLQTGSTLNGVAYGSTASGATNALVLEGEGIANNNFAQFNTLTAEGSGTWSLGGSSVFGDTNVSSGTLSVTGSLTSTTLEIEASAQFTDVGAVFVDGSATNAGNLTINGVTMHVAGAGGTYTQLAGGTTTLENGGELDPPNITNDGLFKNTSGTGTSAVAGSLLNMGTIETSSGALDIEGAVTGVGADTISGASTLKFELTLAAGQSINFLGGGGTLDLIDPLGYQGSHIADFVAGDTVDLLGSWSLVHFSENLAETLGTLTLTNGANQIALNFVGDFAASAFQINSGATTAIGHT